MITNQPKKVEEKPTQQ